MQRSPWFMSLALPIVLLGALAGCVDAEPSADIDAPERAVLSDPIDPQAPYTFPDPYTLEEGTVRYYIGWHDDDDNEMGYEPGPWMQEFVAGEVGLTTYWDYWDYNGGPGGHRQAIMTFDREGWLAFIDYLAAVNVRTCTQVVIGPKLVQTPFCY